MLFPLYFAINSALSLLTLITYLRLQPGATAWDGQVCTQVGTMVLCFLIELLVRLYLTPPLLELITAKTEMEKTVEGKLHNQLPTVNDVKISSFFTHLTSY